MPRQTVILAVAFALASALTIFAALNFIYLGRGYDLVLTIDGGIRSGYHVDFPIWRRAANVIVWIFACGCVLLFYFGHRSALVSTIIMGTMVVSASDVYNYGSIGSPRSLWTVATLLMLIAGVRCRTHMLRFGT